MKPTYHSSYEDMLLSQYPGSTNIKARNLVRGDKDSNLGVCLNDRDELHFGQKVKINREFSRRHTPENRVESIQVRYVNVELQGQMTLEEIEKARGLRPFRWYPFELDKLQNILKTPPSDTTNFPDPCRNPPPTDPVQLQLDF